MAKSRGEQEDEPDVEDLEIISIGSLYRGPWDKKYWSCSRGKDRYPYPVGYHAVRFHDGNICKMEIREASKGPMFMITSADGHSCSGQTPTIAWEKFQRKGVPRMKIWHGKRFSCKIDGAEFFGFKNASVQRLLRELVADVNGTAEQSLLSLNYCNGASVIAQEGECTGLHSYSDLSELLPKPLSIGKRSWRHGRIDKKLEGAASSERHETKMQSDIKTTYSRRKRQKNSKNIMNLPALKANVIIKGSHATFSKPASSSNVSEADELLRAAEEDSMQRNSVDFLGCLGREVEISEESTCKHPGICGLVAVAKIVSLDSSPVDEMDLFNSSTLKENVKEVAASVKDSVDFNDKDLFVNDTLDELQERELAAAARTDPTEDFLIESRPVELDTNHSGGNSEKSELDSVGQEIATSMMTVLLPQALPLLKKVSKKKKERNRRTLTKDDPLNDRKLLENDNIDHSVNISFPVADVTISRHGQMNLENALAQDDGCYAFRYPEHIAANPAPEISQNQQYVHQENNRDLLEGQDTSLMTNFVYHGKEYPPSSAKLLENDLKASVSFLPQNFECDELNLEKSDYQYASMAISSGIQCEEQDSVVASFNTEAKGVNYASTPTAKADVETSNAGNGNCLHVPSPMPPTRKNESLLSETIVNKNSRNSYLLETCPADGNMIAHSTSEDSCDEQTNKSRYDAGRPLVGDRPNISCRENSMVKGKLDLDAVSIVSENQTSTHISYHKGNSGPNALFISDVQKTQPRVHMGLNLKKDTVESNSYMLYQRPTMNLPEIKSFVADEDQEGSRYEINVDKMLHNELTGLFQLIGCYTHPLPILSLLLRHHGNEIYLCVQCGLLVDEVRILFLYKLLAEEPRIGSPCFIGQTSFLPPISSPSTSGIMLERTCLQLTPDGQKLILLGNVKMPYCRERRISCPCSTCLSVSSDNSVVRIVQVNIGYSTVVVSLKMMDTILSVLVCEPNYLVATGESGRLHSWIMNPKWSGQIEEFDLPTIECVSSCIVDLKKVPNHASLVVGYNGFGEFTVWDISRRMSLAKFTAPSTSVHHFLPISSLSLRWNSTTSKKSDMNEYINEIMAATMKNLHESSGSHTSLQWEGEEIAIWLLVSAVFDGGDDDLRNASSVDSGAWWRLALLANNAVVLGSPLDSGAAVIAALSGLGVIGTHNGRVYLWELSTGRKLGTLHQFEGNGVSCIAADDSASSILAVGGCNGDLIVYQRPNNGDRPS